MANSWTRRVFHLMFAGFMCWKSSTGVPPVSGLAGVLPLADHGDLALALADHGDLALALADDGDPGPASSDRPRARRALYGDRPGQATTTHSCGHIRAVPSELRSADIIKPNGLSTFYQKYTEAYSIPVLGSVNVTDTALQRACYVLRFLLADHSRVRQSVYARSGRVAVIGTEEQTTDIPEHSFLNPVWNTRARGLGATAKIPVSTGGEENIVCGRTDRWWDDDLSLHEFLHGVHLLGVTLVLGGWQQRLNALYAAAKLSGLWNNTYSVAHVNEYFAEGAQSYFNAHPYYSPPNGVHGPISTQARLQTYDPGLLQLVREVFPCNNTYLKKCKFSREEELNQVLRLDCDLDAVTTTLLPTLAP